MNWTWTHRFRLTQILLIRNLDPLTKEADIARSLENLDENAYKKAKNGQGPRRIALIKDKATNASWCFAFAIYPDEEVRPVNTFRRYSQSARICELKLALLQPVQLAKAALRTIMDPKEFPTGYTIFQRLVAVTFARSGCFSQAYAKTTWSFTDEINKGKKQEFIYCDDSAYANIYDCPMFIEALERKKQDVPATDDADAFFDSLAAEKPALKPNDDVVKAPPSIDLSAAGTLYASKRSTFLLASVDLQKRKCLCNILTSIMQWPCWLLVEG